MEAYSGFAQVYDDFMDNVPYGEWCDYICGILAEHDIRDGLVLDLGCGTGKMTRLMRERGFDMIGVDLSGEMLEIAREKEEDDSILYLQQDMREFELYGTVRAIICVCDSINYLLEEEDLIRVFSLVNNYLDPGGIFICDMNTEYKYRHVLGDSVICENRETECFTWENDYDEESGINEYALNIFVRQQDSGLYQRFEEYHYQKAYETDRVRKFMQMAGLEVIGIYGEGTHQVPSDDAERIYFVAREHGK